MRESPSGNFDELIAFHAELSHHNKYKDFGKFSILASY
jgi:hypothetical protein